MVDYQHLKLHVGHVLVNVRGRHNRFCLLWVQARSLISEEYDGLRSAVTPTDCVLCYFLETHQQQDTSDDSCDSDVHNDACDQTCIKSFSVTCLLHQRRVSVSSLFIDDRIWLSVYDVTCAVCCGFWFCSKSNLFVSVC